MFISQLYVFVNYKNESKKNYYGNALFFLPLLLTKNNRNNIEVVAKGNLFPTLRELLLILLTFTLTVFAWIFFRAESVTHAIQYISGIFKDGNSFLLASTYLEYQVILILIVVFLLIEWIGREGQHALSTLGLRWKKPLRYLTYYMIVFAIYWFAGKEQQFIYFQF